MREKLVLGLGGTVDYEIVWDSRVIEHLIREYSIRASELDASIPVMSERDLVVTLLAFLEGGAGGERFVASSDIVETFAARFDRRITLGGTCVRAAMAMQALGIESTVHLVSIDDHVRRLLPAGCAYLCSADHDTTDPHLIVQFNAGARVQAGDIDLRAPHPNRVIYANDPPNEQLLLSNALGEVLREAEVFLISGFNVIQDTDLLQERLLDILRHMQQLPITAVVYYEDAGFHIPAMSRHVRDALIGVIDVYSMNEDEMQAYLGRPVDLLAVDEVAEALWELQGLIPAATLVVHTKYWSLALGEFAASYGASLQGGITMASTRYCYGDDFTEQDYREVDNRMPSVPGTRFASDLEDRMGHTVRCLPAFALTVASPTTIGLGDSFVGGFIAALARR